MELKTEKESDNRDEIGFMYEIITDSIYWQEISKPGFCQLELILGDITVLKEFLYVFRIFVGELQNRKV